MEIKDIDSHHEQHDDDGDSLSNSSDGSLYCHDPYHDSELDLFQDYLETLPEQEFMTLFSKWKIMLNETALEIASLDTLKSLQPLLEKFDDQVLHIFLIQQIFEDNFDKKLY